MSLTCAVDLHLIADFGVTKSCVMHVKMISIIITNHTLPTTITGIIINLIMASNSTSNNCDDVMTELVTSVTAFLYYYFL